MKAIFRSYISLSLLLLATTGLLAGEREQGKLETTAKKEPPPSARPSDYVFKAIKLEPSPYDGAYNGRFRFVNRRSKPVDVSGIDKPDQGRFIPWFVEYEALVDGSWTVLKNSYCGTGMEYFAMKPQVPYEFICELGAFEEQEAPLTARIRVGDFVSDPFVLNWKRDRASGAFVAARKQHFQKIRSAFAKAGFKPELLKGDDFCERLLRSVLKATESGREDGFTEFKGELDVTPEIQLNGNIRIDFGNGYSEEPRDYRGMWIINPNKFNPRWFQKTARKHVQASTRGHDGLEMELDDGSTPWETGVRFYLSIEYTPSDKTVKLPTMEKAKQMFTKMLDNMEPWLKSGITRVR